MISLNDVLLAMSNIPVDDPIAEIWGRQMQGGYRIIEYTGTLPVTITANGDALLDYRIYGGDGGVGEPTESGEPAGYKLPIVSIEALYMTVEQGNIDWVTGNDVSMTTRIRTVGKTPVKPATTYTIKYGASDSSIQWAWRFYNGSTFLSHATGPWKNITDTTFTTPNNCDAARMIFHYPDDYKDIVPSDVTNVRIYENSSVITTHVYIGENQLDAGEYVSYGEQKIYKRTENLFPSAVAQTQVVNGVTATCDGNGRYSFSGTATETASIYFIIPKFTYPAVSITDFIVSFFNSPGTNATCNMGNSTSAGLEPANRVFRNSIYFSGRETSRVGVGLKAGETYNFTMSPMVVLGTVAPSQFVPHIVPTDPPVPLPEIPTIDGTTVIDYDGDPKPSQMYVKYKGKG